MKKIQERMNRFLCATLMTVLVFATGFSSANAAQQSIHERMFHHRAIESVVWAMPLLNFKQYRDGHRALGVGQNDIAYCQKD